LRDLGDRTGDIAYFKEGLDSSLKGDAIKRRLVAATGENVTYLRMLADGLVSIGPLRWKCCGDLAGALKDVEEARAGFQQILDRDPPNIEAQRDLASVYSAIGEMLGEAHQRAEALAANRKALAIYERVGRGDPTDAETAAYIARVRARIAALERAH
jgi:tetratricopeptide (TPR) repeat protein